MFNQGRWLIILLLVICKSYAYSPNATLNFNLGNKRDIAAISLVVPTYEVTNKLLFAQSNFSIDSHNLQEFNFDLGQEDYIQGIF